MMQSNPTEARFDARGPVTTDLLIADLVHAAAASVAPVKIAGRAAGRFGRKVFIADLWDAMVRVDTARAGSLTEGCDLGSLKAWLLRAMRLTDGTGAPLVLLARADLVAAMDHATVRRSETCGDGCCFHFVIDRHAAPEEYLPRRSPRPSAYAHGATSRVLE